MATKEIEKLFSSYDVRLGLYYLFIATNTYVTFKAFEGRRTYREIRELDAEAERQQRIRQEILNENHNKPAYAARGAKIIDIPTHLQESRLQQLPLFVSVKFRCECYLVPRSRNRDHETGITQRRLLNGIPVNYKISKTEARGGVIRLIVGGGRAEEMPDTKGAVVVGVRILSEGGCVGNTSRDLVIDCFLNSFNITLLHNLQ